MSKRILIIDDDKELCEELSEILNDDGFSVDYALGPGEGKKLLKINAYDTLILDFKMPQINGIDFLQDIKNEIANFKIFFISGSLSLQKMLKERNLHSYVTGIFSKPLKIEAFLEELRR